MIVPTVTDDVADPTVPDAFQLAALARQVRELQRINDLTPYGPDDLAMLRQWEDLLDQKINRVLLPDPPGWFDANIAHGNHG